MISFLKNPDLKHDAVVFLVNEEQLKGKNKISPVLSSLEEKKLFTGENGQIFPYLEGKRILLFVGLGKGKDSGLTSLRINLRQALLSSYLKNCGTIDIFCPSQEENEVKAIIEGIIIGTYQWDKYLTKKKPDISKKYFIVSPEKKAYGDTITICDNTNLARDLINDNADCIHSVMLEKKIREIVKNNKNVSLEILGEKELKAKGLNLLLGVNHGSAKEPKLIIAKYNASKDKAAEIAIIGKGITFDTGGLNLKPTGHIETMRQDMGGAAVVISLLKNAIDLGIKKNIVFACAIAENAIGPKAYKPGDVIRSYCGKTVEIANTDAEGRLVLADAISYVVKNYKPKRIIDIATLTGACAIALGPDYTGLVTTSDELAKNLINASKETDDRAWRLPSYPELKDSVKSKIADIKNVSNFKGAGGTITGAEFLRQFTEDTEWAHFDIANTAWVDNQSRMYFGYGATGSGIRLLTYYLMNN
ncbi:MAG: leucyl aminopeptidase [Candidatus Omnitrophica bacterium]|nr:leucyl aminopeptidase [Candidatus Omnitrophota bacterium]